MSCDWGNVKYSERLSERLEIFIQINACDKFCLENKPKATTFETYKE